MSTVDPAVRRRDDLLSRRGDRGTLAVAISGLLLIVAGASGIGMFASLMFEDLRHGVIDSVFDDRTTTMSRSMWLLPVTITVGVVLVFAGSGIYNWALRRYLGGEAPWLLAGPIGFAAFTCGFIALVPTWLEPIRIGTAVDPIFETDDSWGWGSWILYRSNIWMPVLLVAIALLFAWAARASARTRRRILEERDRLLQTGQRVPGQIHDVKVHYSSDDSGSRRATGATLTVSYLDGAHVMRFVERVTRGAGAVEGCSRAEVLFDPLRPDVETSVFVTFQRMPLPGDWIGPTHKSMGRPR